MLNFSTARPGARFGMSNDESGDPGLDLGKLWRAGRRQLWIILLGCCLGVACGAIYLMRTVPRYTATTVVVIDSAKDKSGLAATIADLTYDSGAIDSQLELLKSENVAHAVVTDLILDRQPPSAFRPGSDLIGYLQSNLDVRRVGRSYVINVDYSSPDPIEAARISNAFARAYISEQLQSRFDSMQRASAWLEQKSLELRQKSLAADLAIQKFKTSKDIQTPDNRLLGDQQLSEVSSQLITAKSELAHAEARYAQIRDLMKSNNIAAVVTDTLGSPVIQDLRKKYLEAASTEAELSHTLGPDHMQAVKLRRVMSELSTLVFNEMSRIASSYQSDVEVARARITTLERSLAGLAGENAEKNETMVRLQELQRESENYKALQGTFMQRIQQVQEQQSLPGSEAHIITPASAPIHPSYPRRLLSMSLGLFFGGLAGVALAAAREARDNVFRVASDVRDGLGMEFLGILPAIHTLGDTQTNRTGPLGKALRDVSAFSQRARHWLRGSTSDDDSTRQNNVTATGSSTQLKRSAPVSDAKSMALMVLGGKQIECLDPTLNYVVYNPRSSFAETLRGTKLAIDQQVGARPLKVIGFVSMSANEGKSTVSKNFASLLALLGSRVLLVDGDLHRFGLTRKLAKHAHEGVVDVIRGRRMLDEVTMSEPETGLRFLPGVVGNRLRQPGQVLASAGMLRLLEQASRNYEYVVIDLPPIGPSMDVRAASSLFDCFVFVVKWGHTLRNLVQTSMSTDHEIAERCVGVIYNNVELDQIQLYEGPDERSYHYREYASYY
jgi:polysaccharide biosynthesis transport protein